MCCYLFSIRFERGTSAEFARLMNSRFMPFSGTKLRKEIELVARRAEKVVGRGMILMFLPTRTVVKEDKRFACVCSWWAGMAAAAGCVA